MQKSFRDGFYGAIVGSILTGLFTLLITIYQENKKLEFERVQYESSLILTSIDKEDIEKSKKNIRFLIESKLISAKNEKIIQLLNDTTFIINLPKQDTITISPNNNYKLLQQNITLSKKVRSGQIVDEYNTPISNVVIMINPCYDSKNKKFYNCYSETTSDKNGLFKIPIPEEKTYRILITKDKYKDIYIYQRNSKHYIYQRKIILKK